MKNKQKPDFSVGFCYTEILLFFQRTNAHFIQQFPAPIGIIGSDTTRTVFYRLTMDILIHTHAVMRAGFDTHQGEFGKPCFIRNGSAVIDGETLRRSVIFRCLGQV